MMQNGIFTAYFPYGVEETAKRIGGHGFNTVQLDSISKTSTSARASSTSITRSGFAMRSGRATSDLLRLGLYQRHPSRPRASQGQRRALKEIIRNARNLGSRYVISETGTYNTESEWMSDPKNKSEEGFEACRKVIAELAREAYDHGAMFLLETYVNNVVGSVEETVRMFAQVDHPGLGL